MGLVPASSDETLEMETVVEDGSLDNFGLEDENGEAISEDFASDEESIFESDDASDEYEFN